MKGLKVIQDLPESDATSQTDLLAAALIATKAIPKTEPRDAFPISGQWLGPSGALMQLDAWRNAALHFARHPKSSHFSSRAEAVRHVGFCVFRNCASRRQ